MATPTRKRKYEGFAGLSLVPASQFVARVSLLSLSHRRRSQSCSYLHYAVQCSHVVRVWHGGLAAWARATFQYHVNGTDTVGRSVGRSVDARAPVDHDSVGLAQVRPN